MIGVGVVESRVGGWVGGRQGERASLVGRWVVCAREMKPNQTADKSYPRVGAV